jgi:hypothetical protein
LLFLTDSPTWNCAPNLARKFHVGNAFRKRISGYQDLFTAHKSRLYSALNGSLRRPA